MEAISKELDYTPVVSNHSSVVYRSVAPQGQSTVTCDAAAVVGPTEFLISPTVFNPSKSRLNFTLSIAAGGTYYNYIQANLMSTISRIVLYDTATNATWCDVSNCDKLYNMISAPATRLDEFLTKSYSTSAGGVVATAAPYPVEDISKSNVATANDNGANVDLALQNCYLGKRQFYIGGSNAIASLNVSIPWSAFHFTALSTRKNIYTPSNLCLQIYWNSIPQFAFKADSAADPTSNVTACGVTTISNLSLSIASEGNLSIVSQTISKVMSSGISLPVAYPTVTRQAPGTVTNPSYQLNLTSGYGKRILFLVTAFFTSGGTNNTAQVHSNNNNVLTNINTKINSVALKYPAGFDATKGQDWMFNNKPYYEKSAVQTVGEYVQGEWAFIDSFFGEKPLCEVDMHEVDGLDVSAASSTWSVEATTTGTAYTWISAIIGQKMLLLTNQGSQIN
jgi:hypothetical protein